MRASFLTAQAAGPPLPPSGAQLAALAAQPSARSPWAVLGSAPSTPLPSASWAVMGSAPAGRYHGYVVVAWWRGGFGAGARSLGAELWVVGCARAVTGNRTANSFSSITIYTTSTHKLPRIRQTNRLPLTTPKRENHNTPHHRRGHSSLPQKPSLALKLSMRYDVSVAVMATRQHMLTKGLHHEFNRF